jgi:hypothetical protein
LKSCKEDQEELRKATIKKNNSKKTINFVSYQEQVHISRADTRAKSQDFDSDSQFSKGDEHGSNKSRCAVVVENSRDKGIC